MQHVLTEKFEVLASVPGAGWLGSEPKIVEPFGCYSLITTQGRQDEYVLRVIEEGHLFEVPLSTWAQVLHLAQDSKLKVPVTLNLAFDKKDCDLSVFL